MHGTEAHWNWRMRPYQHVRAGSHTDLIPFSSANSLSLDLGTLSVLRDHASGGFRSTRTG